jgi:hypothetical protein
MATKINGNVINFKGKIVSIDIDVHKHSWRIPGLVEGKIVMAITLSRPKHEALKKLLDRFGGNTIRKEAKPALDSCVSRW